MADPTPDQPRPLTGSTPARMPSAAIISETEHGRGWLFSAEVLDGETTRKVELTLSWADYERWTGGAKPPSEVAERALRFVAQRGLLARLGHRFDASTIRRLAPELERHLLGADQDAGWS